MTLQKTALAVHLNPVTVLAARREKESGEGRKERRERKEKEEKDPEKEVNQEELQTIFL